jgi:hypothetical protein
MVPMLPPTLVSGIIEPLQLITAHSPTPGFGAGKAGKAGLHILTLLADALENPRIT